MPVEAATPMKDGLQLRGAMPQGLSRGVSARRRPCAVAPRHRAACHLYEPLEGRAEIGPTAG